MNLELENKLALVTGSTAGIGFAIAKALAAEGGRVIINGRSDKRVTEALAAIRKAVPTAKLEPLALDLATAEAAVEEEALRGVDGKGAARGLVGDGVAHRLEGACEHVYANVGAAAACDVEGCGCEEADLHLRLE